MRHKSTELMGTIKAFVEEYYKNYRHAPSTTEFVHQNLCMLNIFYRLDVNESDRILSLYKEYA